MSYRRLFIIRKDLGLSSGKLAAMVGHCAESYWINILKEKVVGEVLGENIYRTECIDIDKGIYEHYLDGAIVKTVCQAKNLNQLMKAKTLAEEMGMIEGKDFFIIADKCLTELEPEYIDENGDGRTVVGIAFNPLPDEIAHKISKKYHLYMD